MRRWEQAAVILCVAVLAALYAIAVTRPCVGTYHDDGIYAVTAKALAEGKGYRIISLPGEPLQTKYPPVLPVLLALVWRLSPEFPANVPWLKLVPLLSLLAALAVTVCLLREWGLEARWRIAIVLLTAASPHWLYFGTSLMAESTFLLLVTAALWALTRLCRGGDGTQWALAAAAGVACGLAILTRVMGLSLLVAGLAALLVARRWRPAVIYGAIAGSALAGWAIWCRLPQAALPTYYSAEPYQTWHVLSARYAPVAFEVVPQNLTWAALMPVIAFELPKHAIVLVAVLALQVVAIAGLSRRRNEWPLLWWIAAYGGIAMMWLWQPFRFLVVLLPLWLFLVVEGLRHQRRGGAVLALLFAGAFTSGLTASVRVARDSLEDQCLSLPRYRFSHWRGLTESVRAVADASAGEVVFMGGLDPLYFLATGRQAVRSFVTEPYALFYTDSREPLGTAADFARRLEQSPATHLVVHPSPGFAEDPFLLRQIETWSGQAPAGWELLRQTGAAKIYRRLAPVPQRSEPNL